MRESILGIILKIEDIKKLLKFWNLPGLGSNPLKFWLNAQLVNPILPIGELNLGETLTKFHPIKTLVPKEGQFKP